MLHFQKFDRGNFDDKMNSYIIEIIIGKLPLIN